MKWEQERQVLEAKLRSLEGKNNAALKAPSTPPPKGNNNSARKVPSESPTTSEVPKTPEAPGHFDIPRPAVMPVSQHESFRRRMLDQVSTLGQQQHQQRRSGLRPSTSSASTLSGFSRPSQTQHSAGRGANRKATNKKEIERLGGGSPTSSAMWNCDFN